MKRKHPNAVTGSISQYIEKITGSTTNNTTIRPSSTSVMNTPTMVEPKRYGCPYCSLMTKSTSSIYKHQSRKHALFPKIVHKYSTDDPNTRNIVAILEQKTMKKLTNLKSESKTQMADDLLNSNDKVDLSSPSSSSSSTLQQHAQSFSIVNHQRCLASKHITAHNIRSSNGHLSKLFQCCLCNYRAQHRSNVIRHVKKIHLLDQDELYSSNNSIKIEENAQIIENSDQSEEHSDRLVIDCEEDGDGSHSEEMPSYSLKTIVRSPLVVHQTKEENHPMKSLADIHLSINIYLPKKKKKTTLVDRMLSDNEDFDEDIYNGDHRAKIQVTSSSLSNITDGSLYKPHKCCRCFYRSNWKTDMLHHIRLKHHIDHVTKSDYISMDSESALRTFSSYENTFGKVLKSNRLLLPKIDYIDCSWEELKSKLFININENKQINHDCLSSRSSSFVHKTLSSLNNNERNLFVDNHQTIF
ncbi:hypothetical protein I4U23_028642 [Adineta vaga]|nr:hypothetical protein I4U23_028642 [Adineta vaga]